MPKNIFGPDPERGGSLARPARLTANYAARYWFNRCTNPSDPDQTKITSDLLNGLIGTNRKLVDSSGVTEDESSDDMISEALGRYASGGVFFADSGVANAYVLSSPLSFTTPGAYFRGMRILFYATHDNTAASTVNVIGPVGGGLGARRLLDQYGNPLKRGTIVADRPVEAIFDPAIDAPAGAFRLTPWSANSAARGLLAALAAAQSIPTSAGSDTPVVWPTPKYDTDGLWLSGAPSRLVIPAGVRRFRVQYEVMFEPAASGSLKSRVVLDGVAPFITGAFEGRGLPASRVPTADPSDVTILQGAGGIVDLDYWGLAADGTHFVMLLVNQTSGGPLSLRLDNTWIAIDILG